MIYLGHSTCWTRKGTQRCRILEAKLSLGKQFTFPKRFVDAYSTWFYAWWHKYNGNFSPTLHWSEEDDQTKINLYTYIWFITAPKDTETCKINVNPPQDWTFQSNARYNVVKIGQNWGIGQEIGHKIGKLEKIDKWWRKEKNIDL